MPTHGNTFMGGMDKDTSKPKYPNNKYPHSENVRPVTDKGLSTQALENIKGTEEVFEMLDIKGMLVLEATSNVVTTLTQAFQLETLVPNLNIIETIVTPVGSLTDSLFDQIEELLKDKQFTYHRLFDENRMVIYYETNNPRQIVKFNNSQQGTYGDLKWEIYPEISKFRIIGHTPLRDTTILFTVNDDGEHGWNLTETFSQIWKMSYDPKDPKGTAKVNLLYNGRLNFSREHPIEAIARYENTKIQRVYFTDNFNVPRTFNAVRSDTWALRVKDFSLITENALSMPLATTEEQDGGNLPTGRLYVTYRLKKFSGATSAIAPFSTGVSITTSTINTGALDPEYWDYAYATTSVFSTKMLNYIVPFIPIGFDEISIYVVHEANPGAFTSYLLKTDTLTSESSYEFTISTLVDLEIVPIQDLKQYDIDFERVKTLTAKHNRLLFGNIKEAIFLVDFDARAYRFRSWDSIESSSNATVTYMHSIYGNPDLDFTTKKTWDVSEEADAIDIMNKDSTASVHDPYTYKVNYDSQGVLPGDAGTAPAIPNIANSFYTNTLGGSGPNIQYEFTFKEITIDDSSHVAPSNTDAASPKEIGNPLWPEIPPFVNVPASDGIDVEINNEETIDIGPGFANFKNGRIEAYFKGYMRDEVYRFGIVFYSKTGRTSDVKWIADIRMPCAGDFSPDSDGVWKGALAQWYSSTMPKITTDAYIPQGDGETKGWMLGLKFHVDLRNYADLKGDISGFSIVRAPRRQKDKTIIAEGALGEVAYKAISGGTPAADVRYPELLNPSQFKAQKTRYWDYNLSTPTLKALPNEWRRSYGWHYSTNSTKQWFETLDHRNPEFGNRIIRCQELKHGGNYNTGGGTSHSGASPYYTPEGNPASNPGWFFEAPKAGIYRFAGSVRPRAQIIFDVKNWSKNEHKWGDDWANSAINNTLGITITMTCVMGFRIIRNNNSPVQETYFENNIYWDHTSPDQSIYDLGFGNFVAEFTTQGSENYDTGVDVFSNLDSNFRRVATDSFGNAQKSGAAFTLGIGDRVQFMGWMVTEYTGGTIYNITNLEGQGIDMQYRIEGGTESAATEFRCLGTGSADVTRRLFNYTRVIDGNQYLKSNGETVGYGGHQHSVWDDWTKSTTDFGATDTDHIASDDEESVGQFCPQYLTLDCPDLKFITGTKIQNHLLESGDEVKYTLKPVAGYVHISENNPHTNTPPDGSLYYEYDEESAAGSAASFHDGNSGYSEIGYLYSNDPTTVNGVSDNEQTFIKWFSRYTKALALVHNVNFTDRMNFADYGSHDGWGTVGELTKVESGAYIDVDSGKSNISGMDEEDELRFLNSGFCTNCHEYINLDNTGSAIVSPGVFTAFIAGKFSRITKYLINFSFGYGDGGVRDNDPYIGNGNLIWDNNRHVEQHNEYHNPQTSYPGNRVGFYDSSGNNKKIPRRGQVTIVDICRELESQYGGNTFKERKDSEYMSVGHFTRVNDKSDDVITVSIFGGDIFQSAFAEKKLYSENFNFRRYNSSNVLIDPQIAFSPIVGKIYPIQSVVNTDMRVGYNFNNFHSYPDILLPPDDTAVELVYEIEPDDYTCPILYITEKKLQTYLVTGQNILTGEFDNRVYMSQTKINGELFDSWTIFKPLDYMDVDGHYGPINKLEVFNDQVLFYQDKSFGIISLNPQSLITDNSGGSVQLGTGKGLVAFRYISNSVGAFHQWGIVKAKGAVYFFDAYHRKFFRYSPKGPEPLSDLKGMSSWIHKNITGSVLTSDNPILFSGITSVYDQRFNEVIFTFHVEEEKEDILLPSGAASTTTAEEATQVGLGGLTADTPCATFGGHLEAGGVFFLDNPGLDTTLMIELLSTPGIHVQLDFSCGDDPAATLGIVDATVTSDLQNLPVIFSFIIPPGSEYPLSFTFANVITSCVQLLIWCPAVPVHPGLPEEESTILVKPKTSYTLVYNEMIDAFSSFYSHFPRHYVSDSKRIFSQPPLGYPVHLHDAGVRGEFYKETFDSIIELLVNPKGTWTKVFNNIEYLTQASTSGGTDLVDITFDTLRVLNEYQDTGDITLVVDDNVKRRMRTWRTQVPRDGKARIRNPYVTMKFTYENTPNNRRLIIHDILTHYMDAPM